MRTDRVIILEDVNSIAVEKAINGFIEEVFSVTESFKVESIQYQTYNRYNQIWFSALIHYSYEYVEEK